MAFGALALAAPAQAVQFTPPSTARVHTIGSGQPGVTWNTGSAGSSGGEISYTASSGVLTVGAGGNPAAIDVLNYFDTANGACATDSTNCAFNFSPDLELSVEALFDSIVVTPVAGSIVNVTANFGTNNPGAGFDVTWTDPTDSSVVLRGDWVAGEFQGSPTTGLSASVLYNTGTGTALGSVNVTGFLQIDATSLYADLYKSGGVGPNVELFAIDISATTGFSPSLNSILATAYSTGLLPDFDADGTGQTFRVAQGDFVIPEPATGLLVGVGLLGMSFLRRRNAGQPSGSGGPAA